MTRPQTFSLILSLFFLISLTGQAQTYQSGFAVGGSDEDFVIDIASDDFGDLYVLGLSKSPSVDLDPGVGSSTLTAPYQNKHFIAKYNASHDLLWSYLLPFRAHALAVDGQGRLAISGRFEGTVDFDLKSAQHNVTSFAANSIFFASYDLNMNLQWVRQLESDGTNHRAGDIEFGPNGKLAVSVVMNNGTYIDLNPDTNAFSGWTQTCPSCTGGGSSNRKLFAVYNANGDFLWKPFNTSAGGSFHSAEVAFADDGRVAFANTGYPLTFQSNYNPGLNLSWYSSGGSFLEAHYFPQGIYVTHDFKEIKFDESGSLYVLYTASGNVNIKPDPDNSSFTLPTSNSMTTGPIFPSWSGGINDFRNQSALLKYDQNRNYEWGFIIAKYFGGADYSAFRNGLATDLVVTGNSVVVAGHFSFQVDVDPSGSEWILTDPDSIINSWPSAQPWDRTKVDGYVAAYDFSGSLQSAWTIRGDSNEGNIRLAAAANGNIHLAGEFDSYVDLNSDTNAIDSFSSNGGWDVFIALVHLDSTDFGVYTDSVELQICESDSVFLAGSYHDSAGVYVDTLSLDSIQVTTLQVLQNAFTADTLWICEGDSALIGGQFQSQEGFYADTLSAYNGCDSIHTTYLANHVTSSDTFSFTFCSAFMLPQGVLTTNSGFYTETYQNSNGCDSNIVLDLTINYPTAATDTVESCGSYTWINGVTYSASNTSATHVIPNAVGCDSTITLNLYIGQPDSVVDLIVSCDSHTWIDGVTYTASNNTATHTLTNMDGCDSVVTLDLTIDYSNTGLAIVTACDSYTWIDGNTYTSSNSTATHVLTNAAGCDSIVTLNLTIHQSTTGIDAVTACDNYTWMDGNTYTNSNSTATHVLTNAAGCDSTVTLNLTINPSTTGTDAVTACDSYTWMDGNTYTSSNSTATHVLTNAAGCDSIVTLNLTIHQSTTGIDAVTACDNYTWIDGNTYTSSNSTATHVLTNAAGCDSTVTLNLTINPSTTGTDEVTTCSPFIWIDGSTYTSNNNSATYTLSNAAGCDSLVTLKLTIIESTAAIDVVEACDSYTWINGITYGSSNNTATFTLTNAAGCDSIVSLDLTILESTVGSDMVIACNSYTWIDGNTYTANNNTATQTLTNAAGCDSVVTLDLTVETLNTGIIVNGLVLFSQEAQADHQWLICNGDGTYSEILNETNQSFRVSINGEYAVVVSNDNCTDTSECTMIQTVGTETTLALSNVTIYPNPTLGNLTIGLGDQREAEVRVFNSVGQVVVGTSVVRGNSGQIHIPGASGVYFVEIQSGKAIRHFRIVKE